MADYISRKALLGMEYWHGDKSSFDNPCPDGVDAVDVSDIENFPAADVAPVRHGRWIHTDWAYNWTCLDECSRCGYHDRDRKNLSDYNYCPNCGAKMDGGRT